jgi:hypothetical protein
MSADNIESALRSAFLAAIPAAVGNTAFENQLFNPSNKSKWYIFSFMPNPPFVATLGSGGTDGFDGICQIDINVQAGRGKEGVAADIEALRLSFTAGARFPYGSASVIIKSCGQNGTGRLVNSFFRFTVSIGWETRLSR